MSAAYLSEEVLGEIIDRMIEGESLISICKDADMPAKRSVLRFLAQDGEANQKFRREYERAIRLRTINMAEEIIEIGDDNSRDWQTRTTKDGEPYEVVDHDAINRSKLMCDNRWKFLEKLDAKRYGKQMTLAGDPERPVGGYTIIHNHFGHLPDEEVIPKVSPTAKVLTDERVAAPTEESGDDI